MELGFIHFIKQADTVSFIVFILLLICSLTSWTFIIRKALEQVQIKKQLDQTLTAFWKTEPSKRLEFIKSNDPTGYLFPMVARSMELSTKNQSLSYDEYSAQLIRGLRQSIDETQSKMENGLSILASIGSTSPFIGLFGTVWGIYHALVGIASTSSVDIAKISGPVGEALIMTGLGLAVAIPAVLAYNTYVRFNRVQQTKIDGFAHDLHLALMINAKNK